MSATEALQAIRRAHGSLHLGDYDDVDAALEAARVALAALPDDGHPLVVTNGIGVCQTCGARGEVALPDDGQADTRAQWRTRFLNTLDAQSIGPALAALPDDGREGLDVERVVAALRVLDPSRGYGEKSARTFLAAIIPADKP